MRDDQFGAGFQPRNRDLYDEVDAVDFGRLPSAGWRDDLLVEDHVADERKVDARVRVDPQRERKPKNPQALDFRSRAATLADAVDHFLACQDRHDTGPHDAAEQAGTFDLRP